MGIALPQVVTEDRASGAQVIDGSLKFDNDSSQYLSKTFSSAGNRDVWTWSSWVKKSNATEQCAIFTAYGASSNAGYGMLWFQNNGTLYFHNWDGQNNSAQTDALFRDTGWYHIVAVRRGGSLIGYVNGSVENAAVSNTVDFSQNGPRIGQWKGLSGYYFDGKISNFKIYKNKGLTAAEVKQNYRNTKSRYGL